MGEYKNYANHLEFKAGNVFSDYESEFKSMIIDGSVYVGEFFDDIVHQEADNELIYMDLYDVAEILEQSDNVETDWGLWEGEKDPMEAIKTQAFFTYRYDLLQAVKEIVEGFLEDYREEAEKAVNEAQQRKDDFEADLEDLYNRHEEEEDADAILAISERISEVESDIMLAEEKLEEANDYLENVVDTIDKNY